MTKSELEDKIHELEQDVDYWEHEYSELQEKYDDLECDYNDLNMKSGINDLDNFIWRLKLDGLYFDKLDEFIKNYCDLYNEE